MYRSTHNQFINSRQSSVIQYAYLGPWLTFEIQLPQDDFNLLAWVLGEQIPTAELAKSKDDYQLRGLSSEEQLLNGMTKSHGMTLKLITPVSAQE